MVTGNRTLDSGAVEENGHGIKNISFKARLGLQTPGLPEPLVSYFVTTKLVSLLSLSLFAYKMEVK